MKKTLLITGSILVVFILIVLGWSNTSNFKYYKNHFANQQYINDVDCSGLTKKEAIAKITEEWNKKEIVVKTDEEVVGTISDFDFVYDIDKSVDKALNPNVFVVLIRVIREGMKHNEVISMPVKEKTPHLMELLEPLPFLNTEYTVLTADAKVDKTNLEFPIIKEVYGDNIDKERFADTVVEHIEKGKWEIDFKEEDYYQIPKIKEDDESLKVEREYCLLYLNKSIVYDFYNGTEVISPVDLEKMLVINTSEGTEAKVEVNTDAVKEYVANLAARHNTVGTTRAVNTVRSGWIYIYGGSYGYLIDEEKEAEQLAIDLLAVDNVEREPVYARRGYASGENDIGRSYVEVDITAQQLHLFINGGVVMSSPIVTGNVKMGSITPTGIYNINSLKRNTTLKGRNYDGTRYASPVQVWMPFNGEIGLHDAPWRSTFGGDYYLTEGSHGCVNMPTDKAQEIYSYLSVGFPVVVHY